MRWKTAGGLLLVVAIVVGAALLLARYREERARRTREEAMASLEQAYQANEYTRIADLAAKLLEQAKDFPNRERVVYLKAHAAHHLNAPDEAAAWEELLKRYPDSSYAAEALLGLGRLAMEEGDIANARVHLEALLAKEPTGPPGDEALLALARLEDEAGNQEAARELYMRILSASPDPDTERRARERLSALNRPGVFGSGDSEFNQPYAVQLGDKLVSIAAAHQTTVELLERLNPGVGVLHEGQVLTVPRAGGVRLVVDKSLLVVSVFSRREGTDGRFMLCYPIGLPEGGERKTSGEYVVSSVRNVYSPREDGSYGTLGSRYIELQLAASGDSSLRVALHGTNDPSSIGRVSGANSIRLRNADIEELYAFARAGTPVTVR